MSSRPVEALCVSIIVLVFVVLMLFLGLEIHSFLASVPIPSVFGLRRMVSSVLCLTLLGLVLAFALSLLVLLIESRLRR